MHEQAIPGNRGNFVEVGAIPANEARKVLNKPTIIMGNFATMSILVVFFGSIGGIVGGVYLSDLIPTFRHSSMTPLTALPGVVLIALCTVLFILSAYVGTKNSGAAGNRYYRSRARRAIALHLDKWVDPDRPSDVPTHFVGIVDRKNWGKLMLEMATDIGFVQIEPRRKEILFEGDVERFRIPVSAITNCQLVCYFSTSGGEQNRILGGGGSGKYGCGAVEAPIAPRVTKWLVRPGRQRVEAESLMGEIMALAPGAAILTRPPPLP
jgi:hypothetical protein